MAKWIRHWIPNPGVPCSKPLDGSKVESAFHPSKVNKMSTRNLKEKSYWKECFWNRGLSYNKFHYMQAWKKTNFMAPFYGRGSTASRLLSHFEEIVYFLILSSQKFLVLIWSTSERWMAEPILEPPSGSKHRTPGLGIQHLNICMHGIFRW